MGENTLLRESSKKIDISQIFSFDKECLKKGGVASAQVKTTRKARPQINVRDN